MGDALGMPYEALPPEQIPERVEMEDARLGRGTYTDDTQMAIALAESLVECGGVDEEHLARAFVAHHDPDRGYGRGTTALLELWRSGEPVSSAADKLFGGEGSPNNGAAMRIAPLGVFYARDRAALEAAAERSARVTHRHELGVDAAVVQASAVAAAVCRQDVLTRARSSARTDTLRRSLAWVAEEGRSATPAEVAAAVGNTIRGHESVPAAIHAAISTGSFEEAVTFAVRCGGDTDTIAAMAGAIVGAGDGAGTIPQRWLDALEDGPRGRRYVEKLALRLVER